LGTQYHLSRYAHLCESVLVQDGILTSPASIEDGPGLKNIVESVDNREDFKVFMQNYAVTFAQSGIKVPRRDGPEEEGFVKMGPMSSRMVTNKVPLNPTFGVPLGEQMARDGVEVPRILEKCANAIEEHGVDVVGIFRLSGTTSRIQRLKAKLDRDIDSVNLLSDENLQDINDITGVLKLWFRELPEPLMTYALYNAFVDAAKIENDRLRHIRLHERVNELPDANYATLKYLMGHLDKVVKKAPVNQMWSSNLAIVFGPTLFRAPPKDQSSALQDMPLQCKAIETILSHHKEIFVLAEDEDGI